MRSPAASYHGYRFPPAIISHAVWLYHRFCLRASEIPKISSLSGASPSPTRRFGSGVRGSVLRTPGSCGADRDAWATHGTWTNCL